MYRKLPKVKFLAHRDVLAVPRSRSCEPSRCESRKRSLRIREICNFFVNSLD